MSTVTSTGTESVVLEVDGRKIDRWSEYSVNSNFLSPTDGWTFSISGDSITPDMITLLRPGKRMRLTINGLVQCAGYIDIIDPRTTRSGGAVLTVEGRDMFGPVVDSEINPRKRWPDKCPLEKFIQDVLEPFGFTTFFVDNENNTNVQAGKAVARKNKTRKKKLNEYKATSNKPQHNECVFSFLSRILHRYGLWMWPTVDGDGVVVSVPDFDQPSRYRIINRMRGAKENNIIDGGVRRDFTAQPSFIVGRGSVPGKTFKRSKISACVMGPVGEVQSTGAPVGETEAGFFEASGYKIEKETVVVPATPIEWANEFSSTIARPIFLTDDRSRTLEELQKFVQREMSLRTRHAVCGRYIMPGHTQNGVPWTVDSVVDVVDEISNWSRPMWIAGRTFRKSRSTGTTTELELLPLNSLVF